ncbi:hypothetical protein Tcan_06632 [Toxocara canis]|uniref:Uncharacterized protein n=1 Tax=Toxocara canis TaxID=6265 RepID=A0A0B2UY37_TOXCA|nr:hypothetical protein Tcan_06632 [Toxocara canis]
MKPGFRSSPDVCDPCNETAITKMEMTNNRKNPKPASLDKIACPATAPSTTSQQAATTQATPSSVVHSSDRMNPSEAITEENATSKPSHENAAASGTHSGIMEEMISGLNEERTAIVAGDESRGCEAMKSFDGVTKKIVGALTSENVEVVNGISTYSSGLYENAGGIEGVLKPCLPHEGRVSAPGEAAPAGVEISSKTVPLGGQPHTDEVISGLTATNENIIAGLTLSGCTVTRETVHEQQALKEIISGISADNVQIIFGLSPEGSEQLASQHPGATIGSRLPRETNASRCPKKLISGLTNEGTEILCGLSAAPPHVGCDLEISASATSTASLGEHQQSRCQLGLKTPKAPESSATMVIVSGLTNEGAIVISGLACECSGQSSTSTDQPTNSALHVETIAGVSVAIEKQAETSHAEVPYMEVQKAPESAADGLL